MLGWLYRILIGKFNTCEHKWKKVSENPVINEGEDKPKDVIYLLQCEYCGELKTKSLRGY